MSPKFHFGSLPPSETQSRRSIHLAFEDWEPHFLDRVRLTKIKAGQCHWPYGEIRDKTFGYCGLPTEGVTRSFCPRHSKRAYVKPNYLKGTIGT